MTRIIVACAFALGLGAAACGSTNNQVVASEAAAAPAFPAMSWDQVSAAVTEGAVLVDARSAGEYADGHITGAISVPAHADETALAALPSDKATQLITYCGGPACGARSAVGRAAQKLGFTKIAEYQGGYPEWKKNQAM